MDSIITVACGLIVGINLECAELHHLPPNYRFNQVEETFGGRLSRACEGGMCKKTKQYI